MGGKPRIWEGDLGGTSGASYSLQKRIKKRKIGTEVRKVDLFHSLKSPYQLPAGLLPRDRKASCKAKGETWGNRKGGKKD